MQMRKKGATDLDLSVESFVDRHDIYAWNLLTKTETCTKKPFAKLKCWI